jgi:glyoxylase-like metal-dependent hydrolase (beta-lactamase superfamily II)
MPESPSLQQPVEGLSMTPPAPLPFLDGVVVRSFVLDRPAGRLAVYNAPGLTTAAEEIRAAGPPVGLYLNHRHEEMYGRPELDVPVLVHERDRDAVDRTFPAAGTFRDRHTVGDDFEVVPTPGHTPGTTTFLWDDGRHRFLFPGDALWVAHGAWSAVVLDEAAREDYVRSLELLRDLDFDVLVPWGAYADEPAIHVVTPTERHDRLSEVIERVRAGRHG